MSTTSASEGDHFSDLRRFFAAAHAERRHAEAAAGWACLPLGAGLKMPPPSRAFEPSPAAVHPASGQAQHEGPALQALLYGQLAGPAPCGSFLQPAGVQQQQQQQQLMQAKAAFGCSIPTPFLDQQQQAQAAFLAAAAALGAASECATVTDSYGTAFGSYQVTSFGAGLPLQQQEQHGFVGAPLQQQTLQLLPGHWQPVLQPLHGPIDMYGFPGVLGGAASHPAQQQQQRQAVAADVEERQPRRRRPSARKSLLGRFDAAAGRSPDQSLLSGSAGHDSESDTEMLLSSQDSYEATSPLTGPHTPPSCVTPAATPHCDDGASSSAAAGPLPDHALPLQHLLMSERAMTLTSLEAKAIVYKVAQDLCCLHDAGTLHRQVTIASIALHRSGNLATARLMPHSLNVRCGPDRRAPGARSVGTEAYLAPELARCAVGDAAPAAHTPAADLWALGVVLFVLLSGSHVPFGNRGLAWTTIPNMPGPTESVDRLQGWLAEHMACKVGVINEMAVVQASAAAAGDAVALAVGEVRIVGFDPAAQSLLAGLLHADPAQRLTAAQVLSHPWLQEVAGLIPAPAVPRISIPGRHPLHCSPDPGARGVDTATPSPPPSHPHRASACPSLLPPSPFDVMSWPGSLPCLTDGSMAVYQGGQVDPSTPEVGMCWPAFAGSSGSGSVLSSWQGS